MTDKVETYTKTEKMAALLATLGLPIVIFGITAKIDLAIIAGLFTMTVPGIYLFISLIKNPLK